MDSSRNRLARSRISVQRVPADRPMHKGPRLVLAVGFCLALLPALCPAARAWSDAPKEGGFSYPEAKKLDVVDEYHGIKVPDPYRWLENPDAPDTREWIEAENKLTFGYLQTIPDREAIKTRLTDLWNYERYSAPFQKAGRYFFSKNDGLQNHSVLYTMKSLDDQATVLIDPNTFSTDGTVALNSVGRDGISPGGDLMVYGVSDAGSDWQIFKVRHIETATDIADELKWIKFSAASWTKDNKGFFYSRFDEPAGNDLTASNFYQKLYYHRVGRPQAEDELIFARTSEDEKNWNIHGEVTEDGRYLVITVRRGTERKDRVFYRDLQDRSGEVVSLIDEFESIFGYIGNEGPLFWFFTSDGAPMSRVVAINIEKPEKSNWIEIVPESQHNLASVNLLNDMFVCEYLKDVTSLVKVYDLQGKFVRDVQLPGIGSAGGFGGSRADKETFYWFTGFTAPPTIYRYDMATGRSEVFRRPEVDFNSDMYETEQVFYKSKDGTRVPMFITHKKGIKRDGSNPTLLYGYGGFNISLTPRFRPSMAVWLEMGGIYAVPNLRGGGEYGRAWHEAGCKLDRQNVFDDFIAAAEWLIDHKYTSREKLAINGASNGGLLVGACMTQRPDLFGACLPDVGVLDMLRFHKFTIGHAWTSDYGCADNAEEFKVLHGYSPVHNCKPGTAYPATMITTGDHDDRVVPAHSFKFAAALQEAHSGPDPVLIRIETRAGHGAGKPTHMLIEEVADSWAFLVKTLNMKLDWGKPEKKPEKTATPIS